jgi:hypothetical protein
MKFSGPDKNLCIDIRDIVKIFTKKFSVNQTNAKFTLSSSEQIILMLGDEHTNKNRLGQPAPQTCK